VLDIQFISLTDLHVYLRSHGLYQPSRLASLSTACHPAPGDPLPTERSTRIAPRQATESEEEEEVESDVPKRRRNGRAGHASGMGPKLCGRFCVWSCLLGIFNLSITQGMTSYHAHTLPSPLPHTNILLACSLPQPHWHPAPQHSQILCKSYDNGPR
jgi:hypothetical protein